MIKTMLPMLFVFASVCVVLGGDTVRVVQEDNIREVLFRYQFDHNYSGQGTRAEVYCLSVGEKRTDPSYALMKRFADHRPPVRSVSECNIDVLKGVVDKRSGLRGLAFRITGIEWISGTEVKATGGYYESGFSSSGNTYTLKKERGSWKVSQDEMNWISRSLEPSHGDRTGASCKLNTLTSRPAKMSAPALAEPIAIY